MFISILSCFMEQLLSYLTDFYQTWYERFITGWHHNVVNRLINFLASETARWTRAAVGAIMMLVPITGVSSAEVWLYWWGNDLHDGLQKLFLVVGSIEMKHELL
jgi:hypothetical protein